MLDTLKSLFVKSHDDKTVYQEDIISFLNGELERRKSERKVLELQWMLNTNFYSGNQFCDINARMETVEQYSPPLDWMQHESFNKIAPLIQTRLSHLNRVNYIMSVRPRTSELEDYEKASVSTSILRYVQNTTDFSEKLNKLTLWAELTGTAFVLSWWDPQRGPIVGTEKKELEGEKGKAKAEECPIYEGDLDYGLLSPYEVYPESIFKDSVESQRSIIINQVMSVDDIYDRYGIKPEGRSIDSFSLSPVLSKNGGSAVSVFMPARSKAERSEYVTTYFERPGREFPCGRMIIAVNDKLIYYGAMPYPTIPIVAVKSEEQAGLFFGRSVIENLIPLQRAYNGIKNSIHDYIKQLSLGGYVAEEGSIDVEEWTEHATEPGAVLTYRVGRSEPRQRVNYNLPETILSEEQRVISQMEYAAGVSQLMLTGVTQNGITSGKAIENLMNIDSTRLSMTADCIRNGVAKLAEQWLNIYKHFSSGYRVIKLIGSNDIGEAIVWCADDITPFDVVFDTENELLYNETSRKESFLQAYSMGLFTDDNGIIPRSVKRKALELMKVGGFGELLGIDELQLQAARTENSFVTLGTPPTVGKYDDHEIHIEEHKRYILQKKFTVFKTHNREIAEKLLTHIEEHSRLLAAEKQNITTKGTDNGNQRTE